MLGFPVWNGFAVNDSVKMVASYQNIVHTSVCICKYKNPETAENMLSMKSFTCSEWTYFALWLKCEMEVFD